jgi:hypothetical protein
VERNREAGQNPPRVVAPTEEEEEEEEEVVEYVSVLRDRQPANLAANFSLYVTMTDVCLCLQIFMAGTHNPHVT